jgi:hypothetical protein
MYSTNRESAVTRAGTDLGMASSSSARRRKQKRFHLSRVGILALANGDTGAGAGVAQIQFASHLIGQRIVTPP